MTKVYKKNKLSFYIQGFLRGLLPAKPLDAKIDELYKTISKDDLRNVEKRVDYYNKINVKTKTQHQGTLVNELRNPRTPKSYFFDTYEYARHFPGEYFIDYAFGDINTVLDLPMITKSRPINVNNGNNILLNLDKARHFISVKDSKNFSAKKVMMIGRAAVYQEHRIKFYEKHFQNALCDLGQVNKTGGNLKWLKPKLSITEHLDYKFILSLEGNDVATNLKWIMSSNSLAVSPPLKIETWFMEGKLNPGEHFIGIDEDYSNLTQQLNYYLEHESEAKEIIANAQRFRSQFNNRNVEDLTAILVLKKYFTYIH